MSEELKDTGGPAFPTDNERQSGPSTWHFQGMTLRDHFAAKVIGVTLTELWARPSRDGKRHLEPICGLAAKFSYEVADAMLKARGS
jgi:hypothetical protein